MFLHDSIGDRKSQTRSLRLGGKKGVEDLASDLWRNARAGILYGDLREAFPHPCSDRQASSLRHGLNRVNKNIHEHLLHPAWIARYLQQLGIKLREERDPMKFQFVRDQSK